MYCGAAMGSSSTPLFIAFVCTDVTLLRLAARLPCSALLEQILLRPVCFYFDYCCVPFVVDLNVLDITYCSPFCLDLEDIAEILLKKESLTLTDSIVTILSVSVSDSSA